MQKYSGHIVDIPAKRIFDGDVFISDGRIAAIKPAEVETDAPYIMPGFIDSHVHIESTLLLPENYARIAVHQGSVASVCDPHEIANVLGVPGVEFMVENGRKVRYHFLFGIPACVPCTVKETNGATIDSKDVETLMHRPEFYGLAEMMNFVGLQYNDPEVLAKMESARRAGKVIDGHGPGIGGSLAKLMVDSGISCDHEVDRLDLARERIGLGMKIQIREGSAACNFDELVPLLKDENSEGLTMFCTDDKYPDEFYHGYINELAARAVKAGCDLWRVLETACMTPVKHFNTGTGLLQEGDPANFILVRDLKDFRVKETVIDGYSVFRNNHCTDEMTIDPASPDSKVPNVFKAQEISADDIRIEMRGKKFKLMKATEGSLFTKAELIEPKVENGLVQSDPEHDILKFLVYNRYQEKARVAVSLLSGFGIKNGAIASTIAHDSHNITALGSNDKDIVTAVNALVSSKGGLCVVKNGKAEVLELPVAGLMSTRPAREVGPQHTRLKQLAHEIGCPFNAPFMTLSFMALPAIPELKLTDKGLFDIATFDFTSRFTEE